jgi:hypothetical protein
MKFFIYNLLQCIQENKTTLSKSVIKTIIIMAMSTKEALIQFYNQIIFM